jgi:8-oxo-dGTP pyrophosphatase MutT (NUDIX family)
MPRFSVPALESSLRRADRPTPSRKGETEAGVAIVLRPRGDDHEVLVIQRPLRPGDRWSGDAALPGGKRDPGDPDIVATAVREAREEVGLHLGSSLGSLSPHPRSPLWRRWSQITVTPSVFLIEGDPRLTLNPSEVALTRWVSIGALLGPARRGRRSYSFRPFRGLSLRVPMTAPSWRTDGLEIWGMTHGILSELIERAR